LIYEGVNYLLEFTFFFISFYLNNGRFSHELWDLKNFQD
jgi:hypothetical protein